MDLLYKLFVENQVVVMKTNPVNEYLRPHLERGLAPLAAAKCLQIVSGGAEAGERLVAHPGIDDIHLTGSAAVHDRIVWGAPGDEQARRKARGTPRVTRRVTSELGCVTPVIVVPGAWPDRALDYHAAHVATMIANNASFNCNAAKVIVTWRAWPQRHTFLSRVRRVLAGVPPRAAYYPGSERTHEAVLRVHPDAERIGATTAGTLPWTAVLDVDPATPDDPVFAREAWCSLFAETALDGRDAAEFLDRAVAFCNERLWGTLSATILVDPGTERAMGTAFERRVAALRYGSIGINVWSAFSYAIGATTWGAFPGHPLDDIGSGRGVVHNTRMFDRAERSVVRGPFVPGRCPPGS
jgi:acyl-CoA reductase-like NAD-dependent aldehyde dehydrogenase